MSLTADSNGVISGKFVIPPNVPSGAKQVTLVSVGGQRGSAIFSGQGTLEHQTWQQQTDTTTLRWSSPPPPEPIVERGIDPLAQTFSLSSNAQIAGIDLWFVAASTTNTQIQIRETTAGFPNQRVIAEKTILPTDIITGGLNTRIEFDSPALLLAGIEYAIVVLCGDAIGSLSVAEIGKFDSDALRWITDQPYSIGVLLSSSNASTWTAHQDRDMTFRLLDANYTETMRVIALGVVAVTAATDLMLMAYAERPDGATDVMFRLTMPDSSTITVSDGQAVQLAAPVTGNISIDAILTGTSKFSPVLHEGTQLVIGHVATTANYVTRAIPGGSSVAVKVIHEALIPSGANVIAEYKGPDIGDTWIVMPVTATRVVDDGFTEFTHSVSGVNELTVQIQLTLSGNTAARPRVRDLRTFVI